jgi:hypothetical protein
MICQSFKIGSTLLIGAAAALILAGGALAQRDHDFDIDGGMLTYSSGQAVIPAYEGWHPNPDGTIDVWFGYLNQNYKEEPDVPVGPNNFVSAPYGPDAGQPAHFLPRNNRWVFKVRVPADFGDKEIVWTLTSHGKTYKAYGTLKPGYIHDDMGLQREYFGTPPAVENKPPVIAIQGDDHRVAKVGQPITLVATVTDDGIPRVRGAGGAGAAENANAARGRTIPSVCGADTSPQNCGAPNEGAGSLFSVQGLRMGCFVYRGEGPAVKFEPPQPKMWEDHRGGSPWATGYALAPIPKDNKWIVQTTFNDPGTYVVRCLAHDGLLQTPADITFTVSK